MDRIITLLTIIPLFLAGYFLKPWWAVPPVLIVSGLWTNFIIGPWLNLGLSSEFTIYSERGIMLLGVLLFIAAVLFFIGQAIRALMDSPFK